MNPRYRPIPHRVVSREVTCHAGQCRYPAWKQDLPWVQDG